MTSSQEDSDVPEQVSLSTSKRQVIGRKKDVANELAQEKSKRKERNRERDRQLKERSSKQRAEPIPDEEGSSSGGDEEPSDPRFLPDHLFAAALSQPFPAPVPCVPEGAASNAQQKKRKRSDLTPKDRIVGPRAVRKLSKTSAQAAAKRTLPSPSVSKFSSRALNTKGVVSLSRTRGWQRKAVNTGVMKTTNGPAAHFVRT